MRGWVKSKGWVKRPNPQGAPEKWGVYKNRTFEWNIRIKPEIGIRPELDQGSRIPRFDARINTGGSGYINPFTGKIGNDHVGTHLPLEFDYH